MKFELLANDPNSNARAGSITTDHGVIETPIFMPVGTVASVKGVHQRELKEEINPDIILGNTYHFDRDGLLTIRIVQFAGGYLGGDKGWILPDYSTTYPWDPNEFVLDRFERGGVLLPKMSYGPYLQINANCAGGTYCSQRPQDLNPNPCPSGFKQVAFDKCCNGSNCICSNGKAC